jgi:hypothetical protein
VDITIGKNRYELRDFEAISLSEAMRVTELNVHVLGVLLRLTRGELNSIDHNARRAAFEYWQFLVPSLTWEAVESFSPLEIAAFETRVLETFTPVFMRLLEIYPELHQHHEELMREAGLYDAREGGRDLLRVPTTLWLDEFGGAKTRRPR